ncbi:MAG: hypothetical protein RLZ98_2025 [Pseudomonadota bacterium]|jgi:hypothetical protein
MDKFSVAERLMRMDDRVWKLHAIPWSEWTRIPIGPLLILAIYMRAARRSGFVTIIDTASVRRFT